MSKTDDELRERLRLKDAIRGVVRDSLPHPVTTDDWNRLVKGIEQLITARDAEREAAIRIDELDKVTDFMDSRDVEDPNWHVGMVYGYIEEREDQIAEGKT